MDYEGIENLSNMIFKVSLFGYLFLVVSILI